MKIISLKNSILLLTVIIFVGCAKLPDYNTNKSSINPANFKYGKYCGKGHPTFASEPGSEKRTMDLMSIWPPVDDVDLMCYLHDMCYQGIGSSNLLCDEALVDTARNNEERFLNNKRCVNLTRLISTALTAKTFGSENDILTQSVMTISKTMFMLPLALVENTMYQGSYKKYGFPENQGDCKLGNDKPYMNIIVADFESKFQDSSYKATGLALNKVDTQKSISSLRDILSTAYLRKSMKRKVKYDTPIPLKNFRNKQDVFELQRLLNYFDYGDLKTNGNFDSDTKRALDKFDLMSMLNDRGKNLIRRHDRNHIKMAIFMLRNVKTEYIKIQDAKSPLVKFNEQVGKIMKEKNEGKDYKIKSKIEELDERFGY